MKKSTIIPSQFSKKNVSRCWNQFVERLGICQFFGVFEGSRILFFVIFYLLELILLFINVADCIVEMLETHINEENTSFFKRTDKSERKFPELAGTAASEAARASLHYIWLLQCRELR